MLSPDIEAVRQGFRRVGEDGLLVMACGFQPGQRVQLPPFFFFLIKAKRQPYVFHQPLIVNLQSDFQTVSFLFRLEEPPAVHFCLFIITIQIR